VVANGRRGYGPERGTALRKDQGPEGVNPTSVPGRNKSGRLREEQAAERVRNPDGGRWRRSAFSASTGLPDPHTLKGKRSAGGLPAFPPHVLLREAATWDRPAARFSVTP
jgi:hypothetical protein